MMSDSMCLSCSFSVFHLTTFTLSDFMTDLSIHLSSLIILTYPIFMRLFSCSHRNDWIAKPHDDGDNNTIMMTYLFSGCKIAPRHHLFSNNKQSHLMVAYLSGNYTQTNANE